MSIGDCATKYAQRGWRVFPCIPKAKKPLIKQWQKLASTDQEQIRDWWEKWPDANIGLATGKESGLLSLDIDGPKGEASWTLLQSEIPEIPEDTLEQKTGRTDGGRQLLYNYPQDRNIRNRTDVLPGIDVRGEGGYIIIPPSIHPSGQAYTWPYGDRVAIADAPEALLEVLAATKKAPPRPWDTPKEEVTAPRAAMPERPQGTPVIERAALYLRECEGATQGAGGHNALLWAARAMVIGFELSDSAAISLLWSDFNPRCGPPWDYNKSSDRQDFERKVLEAHRTPGKKPRGWLLDDLGLRTGSDALSAMGAAAASSLLASDAAKRQSQAPSVDAPLADPVAETERPPFPIHCFPVPIREYIELMSDVQVVDVAGIALSCMVTAGAAMGNSYRLRLKGGFDVPPTLWGMIIARSGSNKSGPFREIIKPLRAPVPMDMIGNSILNPQGQLLIEDATTESVIDVLSHSPRGLCMANGEGAGWVGSFDRYSQGSKKKTSVDESIWLKLWDCDTYQKNRKTDQENTIIHSASCSVVACIQPEKMNECFDPSQFASGLVPRLLVVYLPKRYRGWSDRSMSDEDSKFWENIIMYLRTLPFASMDPNAGQYNPNILTLSAAAKSRYVDEFNRLAQLVDGADNITALFASKAQGMTARIALDLHGLGAACKEHDIQSELSEQTMVRGIETMQYLLGEQLHVYNLAGESFEVQRADEIITYVKSKGGSIAPRDLQRANNRKWVNAEAAKRDLDRLVASGRGLWSENKRKFTLI